MLRSISVFFSFFFFCLISINSAAKITINVTVNINQPPYSLLNHASDNGSKGLVFDLVTALNDLQTEYHFVLHAVPAERTKRGIEDKAYDMVAMSHLNWGYDQQVLTASSDLLAVKDVFFALKKNIDRIERSDAGSHALQSVVVRGFSYQFLNFERDSKVLKKQFNTVSVLSEPEVLSVILADHADIGVSSSTTLEYFAVNHPEAFENIHIYPTPDSEYFRHFLVRKGSPITPEILDKLLLTLAEQGTLKQIFGAYGLTPTSQFQ